MGAGGHPRHLLLGRSVEGRRIEGVELGDLHSSRKMRVVDESGGNLHVERRFSRLVGLPLRRLPREPGSVVGWENHRLPGTTAFVVELPSGSLSATTAARYARAVLPPRTKAGRVTRPA